MSEGINENLNTFKEDLEKEVDQLESSLNISAMGGKHKIGPLDVTTVLGNLVLLSSIDSPLMSGKLKEGDEIGFDDCVQALYVLAKGEEAIAPIMAISQRISDLMLLKPMVEDNPEILDKLIKKTEDISNARVEFAKTAREFYELEFVGYDFGDIINSLIVCVGDIVKSSKDLPSKTDSDSISKVKKK